MSSIVRDKYGRVLYGTRDARPFFGRTGPTMPSGLRPGDPLRPRGPEQRSSPPAQSIPLPAEPRPSPWQAGDSWTDPESGVTYRIVVPGALKPTEGWATVHFWIKRWRVGVEMVHGAARAGLLDTAIENGSPTRRYRCRNERTALAWLAGVGRE